MLTFFVNCFQRHGEGVAAPALKAEPGLKKGCARNHGATRRSPGGREQPSNVDRAEENGYLWGEGDMKYWSNIFAMAGAACIAVAFIDSSLFSLFWGMTLAGVGYRLSKGG